MLRLRPVMWCGCVFIFVMGILPPENHWLIGLGLAGFIGACFIPKDF